MLLVGLGAAIGLAALVRYWDLLAFPPGHWYDEAHKSLIALYILRGRQMPVYVTDYGSIEAGYAWLLAGWFALLGPSELGSRVFSAWLGTLTIPLLFWAARLVYREHPHRSGIALVSAFGLAGLFWYGHWSRRGDEISLVPIASLLILALPVWAWRQRSVWAFALAGVALGLSQYIAPVARVLPLQALLVFVLAMPAGERRAKPLLGLASLLNNAIKIALMFNVAGEIIEHEVILSVPPDLAPGEYEIAVGLYDTATGQRLPVEQANAREPDRALSPL